MSLVITGFSFTSLYRPSRLFRLSTVPLFKCETCQMEYFRGNFTSDLNILTFILLTFIQVWGEIKFKMNLDIYNKLSTLLNKTTFYKLDLYFPKSQSTLLIFWMREISSNLPARIYSCLRRKLHLHWSKKKGSLSTYRTIWHIFLTSQ